MDLTKSLKPEILRSATTEREVEVVEYWYKRSKQASDRGDLDKAEYYANVALFKGKDIATQEFEKARQREVRSGTWTRDAGHTIAVIPKGGMGISSNRESGGSGVGSTEGGAFGESYLTIDASLDLDFMSDFNTRESDSSFEIFELIGRAISTKSEKLIAAQLMHESGYDRMLEDRHYDFFKSEFAFMRQIAHDNTGRIAFTDIWKHSEKLYGYKVTRLELEQARASFLKKCKAFGGDAF